MDKNAFCRIIDGRNSSYKFSCGTDGFWIKNDGAEFLPIDEMSNKCKKSCI
jgi:hypothetical protein